MIYDNHEIGEKLGTVKGLQNNYDRTPDRLDRQGIAAIVYVGKIDKEPAIIKDGSFWELVEKKTKKLNEETPNEIVARIKEEDKKALANVLDEPKTPGELVPQEKYEINAAGPVMSIKEASDIAKKLTHIIDTCELFSVIQGNKYVQVEGWQALDGMLQVNPLVKNVIETDDYIECQVDIENFEGEAIGRGIARCYFEEEMKKRDGSVIKRWYNLAKQLNKAAVLSMAQTRAIGKANRNKYAWIIRLAGYSPTPSEEMEGVK